ncbi:MBL fold metallo-hydrolase, partial [Candidatus Falkowbacteria bacterium]|nr:MBL fold metallo-hydrolase [Candidatus Falkowbacteria bacterium]
VNILGKPVKVRAHIRHIGGYSGHADQRQLINFVEEIKNSPREIYLVQGEQLAAHTLKEKIEKTTGIPTHVPRFEQTIEL